MRVSTRQVGNKTGVRPWPCPLQNRLSGGHCTRCWGQNNYPQSWGTRPGLSRPKYHRGTCFSVDQAFRGDRPRMAGEVRTDCGVSHADRARLAVSSVIQRQVRLYLLTHDEQLLENKGLTASPTAAVVLA